MKRLWCWRCRLEVPMLDETEFAEVSALYADAIRSLKVPEIDHAQDGQDAIHARFQPVREAYLRLTGFAECNQNAIMHHRLSLYGPPCVACSRPLRTPLARHCAACGHDRADSVMREFTREQLVREREDLRARFGSAYDDLLRLLFEEDPEELECGDNVDEYEPEVGTILPRLGECSSVDDVEIVVSEEFRRWLGPATEERRAACRRVAERIVAELANLLRGAS